MKKKIRRFARVEDLLLDNQIFLEKDINNMKKSKQEEFKKFFEIENKTNYTYEHIEDSVCPDILESISQVAWYMFNKKHKKIPSSFFMECSKFDLKLIDFFIKNANLVYKKVYSLDDFPEVNYIFSYKDCFYTISVSSSSDEKATINSFTVYHPVDVKIDEKEFYKFLVEKKEIPKIGIIKTTRMGPSVNWIDHKTDLKFEEENYNEDFPQFFEDLKSKLTGDNKTGLYLFYGEAGTGKSSAIRHLISCVDRPVVFIPPQMINCLSNPDFTDLVTNNLKGSILVIEDAEKALMKRESQDGFFNSELVSSVLNLTDGLYADLSQTAIIATYNCDRNLIDPALLRKGRLRSEYHFQKLSVKRSQNLIDKQGHDFIVEEPMTLADIFNYEKQYTNEEKDKKAKRVVGFGG